MADIDTYTDYLLVIGHLEALEIVFSELKTQAINTTEVTSLIKEAKDAICDLRKERNKWKARAEKYKDIDLCLNAQAPCQWAMELIERAEKAEARVKELEQKEH